MAQGDYLIQNQSFPSFRSDLNSTLEAINTSNSGTSRPTSAVAGTVWLDTTNATNPTLKFFDGTDDISLAQLDYSANTVNWLDSTVVADLVNDTTPQLGGNLDVNGNSIVSVSNGNITFTPDGTGKVIIDGLSYPTADGTNGQALITDGSGNLSFGDVAGGLSWQSVQTTGFTASSGNAYPCNTTSAEFTVTLPASPSVGDQIQLVDYAGTFDSNALTINPNSNNLNGATDNLSLNGEREGVILTYVDSTQGWIATSGINEGNEALASTSYSADILVIGGGGATTADRSGGGGAGGFRTSTQTLDLGTVYTITVGSGGTGTTNAGGATSTEDGSDSSISGSGLTTITSAGGGSGDSGNRTARSGGSGGGGGTVSGGSGNTPSTSPSQGNDGGTGASGAGGGGGGANAVGSNASTGNGANGGDGTASSITGSSITYAGGGGGGANSSAGSGGNGGGGDGAFGLPDGSTPGDNGTANFGGGAGGSSNYNITTNTSASGGSGVVILSVPTANYSGTTSGSPTVTTSGSNTIIKFTGSGSYTG